MSLLDMQAYWCRDALIRNREEGLRHIAKLLRSGQPVSLQTRELLASILDPDGEGDWKAKIQKRGGKGPVAGAKAEQLRHIGSHLEAEIDGAGRPYEAALADAVKVYGISRTTAVKALNLRREESRIMDEIEEETGERPDAVFIS